MGAAQTTQLKLPDHCALASAQLEDVVGYITSQLENAVEDIMGLDDHSYVNTVDQFVEHLRGLDVLERQISRVLVAMTFYRGLNLRLIGTSRDPRLRQATFGTCGGTFEMPNLTKHCCLASSHLVNVISYITAKQENAVSDIMAFDGSHGEPEDEILENLRALNVLEHMISRVLVATAFYRRLSAWVVRRSEDARRRQASNCAQSGQR